MRVEQPSMVVIVVASAGCVLVLLHGRRGAVRVRMCVVIPVLVLVRASATRARYASGHGEERLSWCDMSTRGAVCPVYKAWRGLRL